MTRLLGLLLLWRLRAVGAGSVWLRARCALDVCIGMRFVAVSLHALLTYICSQSTALKLGGLWAP